MITPAAILLLFLLALLCVIALAATRQPQAITPYRIVIVIERLN